MKQIIPFLLYLFFVLIVNGQVIRYTRTGDFETGFSSTTGQLIADEPGVYTIAVNKNITVTGTLSIGTPGSAFVTLRIAEGVTLKITDTFNLTNSNIIVGNKAKLTVGKSINIVSSLTESTVNISDTGKITTNLNAPFEPWRIEGSTTFYGNAIIYFYSSLVISSSVNVTFLCPMATTFYSMIVAGGSKIEFYKEFTIGQNTVIGQPTTSIIFRSGSSIHVWALDVTFNGFVSFLPNGADNSPIQMIKHLNAGQCTFGGSWELVSGLNSTVQTVWNNTLLPVGGPLFVSQLVLFGSTSYTIKIKDGANYTLIANNLIRQELGSSNPIIVDLGVGSSFNINGGTINSASNVTVIGSGTLYMNSVIVVQFAFSPLYVYVPVQWGGAVLGAAYTVLYNNVKIMSAGVGLFYSGVLVLGPGSSVSAGAVGASFVMDQTHLRVLPSGTPYQIGCNFKAYYSIISAGTVFNITSPEVTVTLSGTTNLNSTFQTTGAGSLSLGGLVVSTPNTVLQTSNLIISSDTNISSTVTIRTNAIQLISSYLILSSNSVLKVRDSFNSSGGTINLNSGFVDASGASLTMTGSNYFNGTGVFNITNAKFKLDASSSSRFTSSVALVVDNRTLLDISNSSRLSAPNLVPENPGGYTVQQNMLFVDGNVILGGLTYSGEVNFTGSVSVASNITLTGSVTVGGVLNILNGSWINITQPLKLNGGRIYVSSGSGINWGSKSAIESFLPSSIDVATGFRVEANSTFKSLTNVLTFSPSLTVETTTPGGGAYFFGKMNVNGEFTVGANAVTALRGTTTSFACNSATFSPTSKFILDVNSSSSARINVRGAIVFDGDLVVDMYESINIPQVIATYKTRTGTFKTLLVNYNSQTARQEDSHGYEIMYGTNSASIQKIGYTTGPQVGTTRALLTTGNELPTVVLNVTIVSQNASVHDCPVCDRDSYVCSNETGWNNGTFLIADPRDKYPGYTISAIKVMVVKAKLCSSTNSFTINLDQQPLMSFYSGEESCECDSCKTIDSIENNDVSLEDYNTKMKRIDRIQIDSYDSLVCISSIDVSFTLKANFPLSEDALSPPEEENKNNTKYIIIGVVGGVALLAVVAAIVGFLLFRKKKISEQTSTISTVNLNEVNVPTHYSTVQSHIVASMVNKDLIIPYSKIRMDKRIGRGAFGEVFLAEYNGSQVAVKSLVSTKMKNDEYNDFMKEADTMSSIPSHPNIVLFMGITISPDPTCIVLEYCEEGSLESYLKSSAEILPSQIISWACDIAKGMYHLHKGKKGFEIIHRDLAARNVLLKQGLVAAVSDFGMARVKEAEEITGVTSQNIGPIKWMSPESMERREYSCKSDVFSYGVVLWEIVSRRPPWEGLSLVAVSHEVLQGNRLTIPEDCPEILASIMDRCWAHLPEDRIDFAEIIDTLNQHLSS